MDGVSHGSGPIDRYVDGLAGALRGPRRHRHEMVTEARDSLLDAAEAYADAGQDPLDAQRRAVAEFGTYRQVVPGYQAELATLQGRRTAMWIAFVLPVMTLLEPLMWWDTSWSTDERASHVYWVLVDHFQYTSFLAAGAAGLAVVGFGWGSRFLRDGLQYARLVGQATVVFLGMHALLGASVFVLSLRQWPAAATWPPVLIGIAVNAAAFGYAGLLAVRCVSVARQPRLRAVAG
ncbi:permease prefix domain 1-containing protein [Dactylosporangium cerinum]|uniref:Permease prefix domain 1-containing protein n=1 Tax=Dactylosporangium cerinum TaxID=1434730 RepID=A0ABV9VLK3_9ACTN